MFLATIFLMLFIFFLLFKDISSNSGISVNNRIEKLKLLKESLENNDPNSDQIIEEFKDYTWFFSTGELSNEAKKQTLIKKYA